MKLPISWLKKYIDVTITAEKLADLLTLSGSKVEQVEMHGPESVIEIEVTTNRPDCLSILGLAHEVSAITGKKVRRPSVYGSKEKSLPTKKETILIDIEDKKGCPRYTGRVIRDVNVAASPAETEKLLGLVGTRAISNVVDVTNFVLFECGQPMHAFDLDKIRGGRILVRRSKKGEKFSGLDGIEYTLDEKTLVIADAEGPIAIAGVIGGKLTEVTSTTKNILLESAYFDPALVRQVSKRYKISTESSYRFERSVDPECVGSASLRASELLQEWAGGRDTSGLLDKDYSPKAKKRPVVLRLDRLEKSLGQKVPLSRVLNILKALSFSVQGSAGKLKVEPPSSRRDIAMEADLIEEVLRIEGFDKAPQTLPDGHYSGERYTDRKAEGIPELKKFMAHLGFDEIMTYSLLSEKMLIQSGFELRECHAVANAVSAEQAYFRPSMLPGMLQAVQFNAHRKATSLKFFEVGNCYVQGREETRLALAVYGKSEENWQRKIETSYYELKGVLQNVLDHLKASDRKAVMQISEVRSESLKRWDIPHPVFFGEIDLQGLWTPEDLSWKVKTVPKFPGVQRDVAFIVDSHVRVDDLEQVMRQAGSPHLRDVTLFDQYLGKNIPQGKRSLAFSIAYQKDTGTFTEDEIQALQGRLGEALKSRFQVEFR